MKRRRTARMICKCLIPMKQNSLLVLQLSRSLFLFSIMSHFKTTIPNLLYISTSNRTAPPRILPVHVHILPNNIVARLSYTLCTPGIPLSPFQFTASCPARTPRLSECCNPLVFAFSFPPILFFRDRYSLTSTLPIFCLGSQVGFLPRARRPSTTRGKGVYRLRTRHLPACLLPMFRLRGTPRTPRTPNLFLVLQL